MYKRVPLSLYVDVPVLVYAYTVCVTLYIHTESQLITLQEISENRQIDSLVVYGVMETAVYCIV